MTIKDRVALDSTPEIDGDERIILLRPFELRQLSTASVLLALDCGLLLGRIDLHKGRAIFDLLAGVHENLRDYALDLRHDYRRVARFQSRNVLRGIVHFLQPGCHYFYRHRVRSRSFGGFAIATTGGEQERSEYCKKQSRQYQLRTESKHNFIRNNLSCCQAGLLPLFHRLNSDHTACSIVPEHDAQY